MGVQREPISRTTISLVSHCPELLQVVPLIDFVAFLTRPWENVTEVIPWCRPRSKTT